MFEKANTAHDRVVREETTKVLASQEVKNAMRTLEDLFEKCKSFYTPDPPLRHLLHVSCKQPACQ